ncbi:hypothetical protein MDAP_000393 [Mitosporidium daphniae]
MHVPSSSCPELQPETNPNMLSPPSSPLPLPTSYLKIDINNPSKNVDGTPKNQDVLFAFFEMSPVDGALWKDLIPHSIDVKKRLFLGQGNHANVYKGCAPLKEAISSISLYPKDLRNSKTTNDTLDGNTSDNIEKLAVKVFHREDPNALFIALRELYFQSEFFKSSPSLGLKAFGVLIVYKNFMFFITRTDNVNASYLSTDDIRYSQVALLIELGENGSLANVPKKVITSDFILKTGHQLSSMLVSLFELNFIHGDIKPHNLFPFFSNHGGLQVKLGDFSSTIRLSTLHSPVLMDSCGTQAYLAPDLLLSAVPSIEAIKGGDAYAIGVTLWSLITGCSPFGGITSSVPRLIAIKRGFFECGQNPWKLSLSNSSCLLLPSGETVPAEISCALISIIEGLLQGDASKRISPQDLLYSFQKLLNCS